MLKGAAADLCGIPPPPTGRTRAASERHRPRRFLRRPRCVRGRDAHDGPVSGNQAGQSGLPFVLPDGRFLRVVLRRRAPGISRARHRADQARPASGRGYPHVRRAGPCRRGLSLAPDPERLPRRRLRTDGRPRRGEETRQQRAGPPRRGAGGDAGHAHRRRAARCAPAQLPGRAGGGAGRSRDGLARHLDGRLSRPARHGSGSGLHPGAARSRRTSGRGSAAPARRVVRDPGGMEKRADAVAERALRQRGRAAASGSRL